MKFIRKKINGFTFIELMVSLVLLALLASVIIPVSDIASHQSKERELKFALLEIRKAIDSYKEASDKNEIPKEFQTVSGYPPNLKVLEGVPLNGLNGTQKIKRFIRKIPADPFYKKNNEKVENEWGIRSYLSEANDPKVGEDVYDVYSLSKEIGSNGISYNDW